MRSPAGTAVTVGEGMIASDRYSGQPGHSLAQWLAHKFNHNFDDYDRAIDSVYNSHAHVGGSMFHHLLDGQHSIWGAFHAVQNVADHGWLTDMGQALEHLARDTMSVSGINPLFSLSPAHFDSIGQAVAHVGITKLYLADALTVNGPELLGGSIALISALMMGRKAAPERLSRFSGGCLLSSAVAANPALLPIAAAGLVYAFVEAEDKRTVVVQAGKGALVSGTTILVSSLIGGPVWLGCVAGLMAGVAVSKMLDNPQKAFERAQAVLGPAAEAFRTAAVGIRALRLEECV